MSEDFASRAYDLSSEFEDSWNELVNGGLTSVEKRKRATGLISEMRQRQASLQADFAKSQAAVQSVVEAVDSYADKLSKDIPDEWYSYDITLTFSARVNGPRPDECELTELVEAWYSKAPMSVDYEGRNFELEDFDDATGRETYSWLRS